MSKSSFFTGGAYTPVAPPPTSPPPAGSGNMAAPSSFFKGGTAYVQIPGLTGSGFVSSFKLRQGAVVPASGDYTASLITNVPAGSIVATDVQGALNYLDTRADKLVNYVRTRLGASQVCPVGVTKIQFKTVDIDLDHVFDATTNYRYTPTVPGIYLGTLVTQWVDVIPINTLFGCAIFKNGVGTFDQAFPLSRTGIAQDNCSMGLTTAFQMNGTTDYLECYTYQNDLGGASHTLYSFGQRNSFSAIRIG